MLPAYWAESRTLHQAGSQQVTIRRFGWSDVSYEDAQAMADAYARDALERAPSGEPVIRREPKVPCNGAVGVPILKEMVERHGRRSSPGMPTVPAA